MAQEPYLEGVIDSQPRSFRLEPGGICYIGRDAHSAIVLADGQVSRQHALVQCLEGGECHLIDLGSRNGTLVNQRRVTAPVVLQPGDRITVGSHEFVFHSPCNTDRLKTAQRETVVDFTQRVITVLVADIRDFTGLSSRLPHDRLSQVINAFNRDSGTVLAQHGAWTQKYIGDAVMALWLHPSDAPDLPDVCSVLEALRKLFDIASALQPQFGLDFPIRIGAGINTGLACIGNMGSDAAPDYTALSDAVNLAFRLESATKEIGCDLALGRKTYELLAGQVGVGGLFEARTMMLKGYCEPKPVYAASRDSLAILLRELQHILPASSAPAHCPVP